jgi:hypothetical protein
MSFGPSASAGPLNAFIDTTAAPYSSYATNPLSGSLDCGTHDLTNGGTATFSAVESESLALPAGSLETAVSIVDSLAVASGKSVSFQTNIALASATNADLAVTSTAVVSAVAAGAATGTWLRIKLNGVYYKVALLADS